MTLKLSDGRISSAWFLPEPRQTAFLATVTMVNGLPYGGGDIRQKTAAVTFGNGATRTGWLLGFFPGLTHAETEELAGQEVAVTCDDVDGRLHGYILQAQFKKPGPTVLPGLTAQE